MTKENNGLSIIVCNYNSPLEKILLTLSSCIKQKSIDFEIIYCDDASKNSFKKEIEDFFAYNNFSNYILSINSENQGTVKNLYNGLKKATKPYAKTIGAGDLFYDCFSCQRIVGFMVDNKTDFAYCDSAYFFEDTEIKTFDIYNPKINKPYNVSTYNQNKIIKNTVFHKDFILGASIFSNTSMLISAFERGLDKVIYAEDFLLQISFIYNAKMMHYNGYGVYYEYGSGISTCVNKEFQKKMDNDYLNFLEILKSTNHKYAKKTCRLERLKHTKMRKIKKVLLCPSLLLFRLKKPDYKKKEIDFSFYEECKGCVKDGLQNN